MRAEAGYEWSNFYRRSKEKKSTVVAVLTSAFELAGESGSIAEKALYRRGTVQNSVDPKRPDAFFADMNLLLQRFPDGAFRLRSLFWRGRIAERDNDIRAAKSFYQQVVDEAPYDYYGLRASMHLDHGSSAISMALPQSNSKTWVRVREGYRNRGPDVELEGATPYHDRLRAAERTGLYRQLLAIVDGLGKRFRNRLDNIPLEGLDQQNLIPAAALLLALRQDALADAAWPIDGSTALSESLMYGVIRRESTYYSGAISAVGALGLFQIMPLTFENRPECCAPSTTGQKPTPTSYLFDPVRNTQFWSCWVRKEFDPQTRDGIALMLVNHHAGAGHLDEWMKTWKGHAIERDLELQIDTYRFPATSVFVRYVLSDVAIADAAGPFKTGIGNSRRDNR